jgi:hypothetical protein
MTVGPVARDEATAEFFDGTARGEFLLGLCSSCQAISAPQARQCETCGSTGLGVLPAGGGAAVVSWAVSHRRPDETGNTHPLVLVIAELDEGPWWWSQVTDADPDDIEVGTRLRIAYERAGDDYEFVPVFHLANPRERSSER